MSIKITLVLLTLLNPINQFPTAANQTLQKSSSNLGLYGLAEWKKEVTSDDTSAINTDINTGMKQKINEGIGGIETEAESNSDNYEKERIIKGDETVSIRNKNYHQKKREEINDEMNPQVKLTNRYKQIKWDNVIADEKAAMELIEKIRTNFTSTTTTTEISVIPVRKCGHARAVSFFNLIFNGSAEDLRKLSPKKIGLALKGLSEAGLPLQKKLIVWEVFKGNRSVEGFGRGEWEKIGRLILDIPEDDLLRIDVENSDIVDYLGTLTILPNRKAMLLAYKIKSTFGKVLTAPNRINQIKGLLCGFSLKDLRGISVDTLLKIKPAVFKNLWSCTIQQIQVLLELCMSTYVYGYIETWNEDTLEHLGFLTQGLSPERISRISPAITFYLSESVVGRMDFGQISAFTESQVVNFNDGARTVYNYKSATGSSSRNKSCLLNKSFCVAIAVIYFKLNVYR